MPLKIIRNDITKVRADAIVNTANPRVTVGTGTDQAIYEAAGWQALLEERAKIGMISPGKAAYTPAFALPAKYVIHTVGPVWRGGGHNERSEAAECYRNCLSIADELGCETIAFPLISAGSYGFPKDEALRIAVNEISGFLFTHDMTVYLVVYDRESYVMSGKAFADVRSYIEEHEVKRPVKDSSRLRQMQHSEILLPSGAAHKDLTADDIMKMKGETFSHLLLEIIDSKGLKDPDVYRKSNIDRKLFSKIRNNTYSPSKRTVMALTIGLELNLDEATDLMQAAGYSFAPGNLADVTVKAFIEQGMYDINLINCVLFDLGCKTLG